MTVRSSKRSISAIGALAFLVFAAPGLHGQTANPARDAAASASLGTVQNGLFLQGKESYRVVDTAGFRTAADIGTPQPGSIAKVQFSDMPVGGCAGCGLSSCGGGCGTGACGSGSCGSNAYSFGMGGKDACNPCTPYRYVSVEALYMDNDSVGNYSLSRNFRLDDFDFEIGSRITIGAVPDCVHGYELTFVGPFEWTQSSRIAGAGLRTDLRPGQGVDLLDLSSFADFSEFLPVVAEPNPEVVFNSVEQSQRYEADYWSLEVNRTLNAGQFAKLLYGGRYINYDELYVYKSRSTGIAARPERNATPNNPITGEPGTPFRPFIPGRPAGNGTLLSETTNDLFGLQIGLDMLYPICCHGYTDLRARAGAYLNTAENQFLFINENTPLFQASDSDAGLAGVFELDFGFRYQVGEILTLRMGAELWYLTEIATATDQFRPLLTPTTGSNTRTNDSVLMTGLSLGAELRY
jgi:hypothetical protein